ncbi:MAG: hypothetical protein ACRDCE_08365 [Cetobacterium sp.]
MHLIIAPTRVLKSAKQFFVLNLNQYRNTHYQSLNKAKVNFKELMKEQISTLPTFNRIRITYTIYPESKRLCDVSNISSIVDKFFSDALVELGKLPDDNYLYLPEVNYRFGAIDKTNPRVEILIEEL